MPSWSSSIPPSRHPIAAPSVSRALLLLLLISSTTATTGLVTCTRPVIQALRRLDTLTFLTASRGGVGAMTRAKAANAMAGSTLRRSARLVTAATPTSSSSSSSSSLSLEGSGDLPKARPTRRGRTPPGPPNDKEEEVEVEEASGTRKRQKRPSAKQVKGEGKKKAAAAASSNSLEPVMERSIMGKHPSVKWVVGVDEAGRGPLAGPVVAAACYIPLDLDIPGIQDSKQLNEEAREAAYHALTTTEGVKWCTSVVGHQRIDEINILQATMEAMATSLHTMVDHHLAPAPAAEGVYALIDGNRIPQDLPVEADCVIKGDSKVRCIAAASIIAKVTRDRLMVAYHEQWPQYNFAGHKGYPTAAHVAALARHGPCPIHRMTFAPIKKK